MSDFPPGVWFDPKDNSMHLDLAAICRHLGLAHTPQNEQMLAEEFKKFLATHPDVDDRTRKVLVVEQWDPPSVTQPKAIERDF